MTLATFNTLDKETAKQHLFACCGSDKWASAMMSHFPFASEKQLVDLSASIWYDDCGEPIGENLSHTIRKLVMSKV